MKNNNPKILIVDASKSCINLLQEIFNDQDFEIISTSSGLKALDIISKEPLDIVLMDPMIPDMNGFEIIGKIVNYEKTKNISVIIITAINVPEYKKKELELGISGYIIKPYHYSEVLSLVHSVLFEKFSKKYVKSIST